MPSHRHAVEDLLDRVAQRHVAFTATGSAALEAALEVLGIGPGAEVVVPDIGCHSPGAAVVRRGAVPVFTGVGPSLVLDAQAVLAAVSPQTQAVVAIHQYGLPCDVRAIAEVLPARIRVIEDIAQAWGTTVRGAAAGASGVLAVTSFGPSKPVSLGGGGAVLGPTELLEGAVAYGDLRDRWLARIPSPARMPDRLLEDLAGAITTADEKLARRRAAVEAFLGSALAAHFQLPPHPEDSTFAWTRLPLYPNVPGGSERVPQLSAALGPAQQMHGLPPSMLPMFKNSGARVVPGSGRTTEPVLVKIG